MRIFIAILAAISLQACSKSLYTEGTITQNRIQVQEHHHSEHMKLGEVSDSYLESLARHYDKYGDGPLRFSLLYNTKTGSAMKASARAAEISTQLRQNGVPLVQGDILPVQGECSVMISYEYYTAHGPKDCTMMAGYADRDIGGQRDYSLGCTVETLIAQQVARPKDLLGQESRDPITDGRTAANIVNASRTGALNKPLRGQTASGK